MVGEQFRTDAQLAAGRRRISLDDLDKALAAGEVQQLNLIIKGDVAGSVEALEDAITKPAVELQVLKRLELKARTYGTDPSAPATDEGKKPLRINVDAVVAMYRDWVIPMTKEVEINYLLQRLNPVKENGVNV